MKTIVGMLIGCVTLGAAGTVLAAGDAAAGEAKSALCASCHGANGMSAVPNYPNLAGQKDEYLVSSLKAYRAGERQGGQSAVMSSMATPLTDADIDNLAAYYAGLKP